MYTRFCFGKAARKSSLLTLCRYWRKCTEPKWKEFWSTVGKAEGTFRTVCHASQRGQANGNVLNLQCVCFLTEENICESCLSPILPTGKMPAGEIFPKHMFMMAGIENWLMSAWKIVWLQLRKGFSPFPAPVKADATDYRAGHISIWELCKNPQCWPRGAEFPGVWAWKLVLLTRWCSWIWLRALLWESSKEKKSENLTIHIL